MRAPLLGLHRQSPFSSHTEHRFLFSSVSSPEPPQQPLSVQSSSGGLSHKQLHAQLTQRLEQVLREREQQEQNPPEVRAAGKEAGLVKNPQRPAQTKLRTTEQSGWAQGNGTDMTKNKVRGVQYFLC